MMNGTYPSEHESLAPDAFYIFSFVSLPSGTCAGWPLPAGVMLERALCQCSRHGRWTELVFIIEACALTFACSSNFLSHGAPPIMGNARLGHQLPQRSPTA